jgi:S-formylglutathione hydrolase FrmB
MRATVGRIPALPAAVGAAGLLAAFLTVGAIGVWRYGLNYWVYRGFAPPRDPAYVRVEGTTDRLQLTSAALGGRAQDVYVYLPPGYASHPSRRYPVLYLLHGFPGRPLAFLQTVRMGVVEDSLVARNEAQPLILVMPFGSTGTFTDKEWANGVGKDQGWATFVSRDLVRAIDARYRTIPTARGRAIAGLSEGGFGAINIAFHNPHEFSVVESWSGYEKPDKLRSIFGSHLQLLSRNDPAAALASVAPTLRRAHTFIWFYSGKNDPLSRQNRDFHSALRAAGIPNEYFEASGGHNWALWRLEAERAYRIAAERLSHA